MNKPYQVTITRRSGSAVSVIDSANLPDLPSAMEWAEWRLSELNNPAIYHARITTPRLSAKEALEV